MLLQGFLLPIILSCWETAGENIETLVIVSVPYCFQVSGLRSKSMVTFFLNLNGVVLNEGNAVNRMANVISKKCFSHAGTIHLQGVLTPCHHIVVIYKIVVNSGVAGCGV